MRADQFGLAERFNGLGLAGMGTALLGWLFGMVGHGTEFFLECMKVTIFCLLIVLSFTHLKRDWC